MIDEACCFPDRNVIRKIEVEDANGILTSLLRNLVREVNGIRIPIGNPTGIFSLSIFFVL